MEFVSHLNSDVKAAELAAKLGLPEGSTWRDINKYESRQAAARYITEHSLPLPEDSSWGTILAYQTAVSATIRAAELGLPYDSTWRDITHHQNQPNNLDAQP